MEETFSQLRDQLVQAAHRRHESEVRRTRILQRSAGALAVVAVLAIAVSFLQAERSEAAALDIERSGTVLDVKLIDSNASVSQVTSELADAGLDPTVRTVPVFPAEVGRFVAFTTLATLSPAAHADGSFVQFRLDTATSNKIDLQIGRAAKPDEPYQQFYNAYLPGGPLHCSKTWGARALFAETEIKSRFKGKVEWNSNGMLSSTVPADRDFITFANQTASDRLVVQVSPEPLARQPATELQGCNAAGR